ARVRGSPLGRPRQRHVRVDEHVAGPQPDLAHVGRVPELARALLRDLAVLDEARGEVDDEDVERAGGHLDRPPVDDRVDVLDVADLRLRAVAEAERDRGLARPDRAHAQAPRLGELAQGRVVPDRRDAEAHLAVQVDAVVPELAVGALLPPRPDLVEADPHAAVDDRRALADDAGARVGKPRPLGQVPPHGAGLVRVVRRRLAELLHLDALVAAPGRGRARDGAERAEGGPGWERALGRTHTGASAAPQRARPSSRRAARRTARRPGGEPVDRYRAALWKRAGGPPPRRSPAAGRWTAAAPPAGTSVPDGPGQGRATRLTCRR